MTQMLEDNSTSTKEEMATAFYALITGSASAQDNVSFIIKLAELRSR